MLKGLIASAISVVGVIYTHFIWDKVTPVNFYMTGTFLIGLIALIGINLKNSLLIIDFLKQLIQEKPLDVDRANPRLTDTLKALFFCIFIYIRPNLRR